MPQDHDQAESTKSDTKERKSLPKWLILLLALLFLAALGLLIWLWLTCHQHTKDLEDKNKELQGQIDELKKKAEPSAAPTTDPAPTASTCPEPTNELRANIAASVTSRNYAALQGYMTNPITVVYAASEFGWPKTPAEAVSAMAYLNNGTAPWDFNLPAATLAAYRAGDYHQYFPAGAYIGKSSDGVVASFGFDCGKINLLFISLNDLM